jgi:folate-dependent tRNA-U54 methylase TrmFO/GidA
VTAKLEAHPLVTIVREEIAGLPPEDWDNVIVATGPLTSPALAEAILKLTGEEPELLRRHRPHRPRRLDRLRHRLAPVAL